MVTSEQIAPVLAASTREVEARERFDFFCGALCDIYLGIHPERTTTADFTADVLAHQWDDIVLSRIRAPGHDAHRDRRAIAAKPDDALFLNFSSNASATLHTSDADRAVPSGTPVLLDNAEPFRLSFDPSRRFHLYSLRLPRVFEGRRIGQPQIAEVNDRLVHTRAGRQLRLQTRLMADEFDAGRTAVAGLMATTITSLLAVLLHSPGTGEGTARLESYQATAASHLADPAFSVRDVAAIHRVSVRTVQNSFADSGTTFTAWITGERLDLARDRVEDPAWSHRSLERIALSCGISDPSGFQRMFRARFGEPPGAFRPKASAN